MYVAGSGLIIAFFVALTGDQDALRACLLQRFRSSTVGTVHGCWPVGFGSRKGTSRSGASNGDAALSASAPASPSLLSSRLDRPPLEVHTSCCILCL